MNTLTDLAVTLLPTFFAIVTAWVQPPQVKHAKSWRVAFVIFGLLISSLTYLQLHHNGKQSAEWEKKAETFERMLSSTQEVQRETKRKLDESIQREQRLNDQNNDLQTNLDNLREIVKRSLPPKAQKEAEKIPKHWKREIVENVGVSDSVTVNKQPQ